MSNRKRGRCLRVFTRALGTFWRARFGGEIQPDAGHEVEAVGWVAEDLFVFLIEEIVELAEEFDVVEGANAEAGVGKDVAVVAEQAGQIQRAGEGALVGLEIEDVSARVAVAIEAEAAAAPGDVVTAGIPGAANQWLADLKGTIGDGTSRRARGSLNPSRCTGRKFPDCGSAGRAARIRGLARGNYSDCQR